MRLFGHFELWCAFWKPPDHAIGVVQGCFHAGSQVWSTTAFHMVFHACAPAVEHHRDHQQESKVRQSPYGPMTLPGPRTGRSNNDRRLGDTFYISGPFQDLKIHDSCTTSFRPFGLFHFTHPFGRPFPHRKTHPRPDHANSVDSPVAPVCLRGADQVNRLIQAQTLIDAPRLAR